MGSQRTNLQRSKRRHRLKPVSRRREPATQNRFFDLSSRVIGQTWTRFIWRTADLLRFDLIGRPWGLIGSVDITYRCNLQCAHCYFEEQGFESELTDDEWIAFFEALKGTNFPFYQCSWVGGEPLVRKDLVGRLRTNFKNNLVATNGTIDLPDWPDVSFYVSVDGTELYYGLLRKKRGLYGRIKENVNAHPHLNVRAAMVVTRHNHECIEEFLQEWSKTSVRSILFQFYTPIRGQSEDNWMGWELRDRVIDRLLALKKRYGKFVENHERVLRLMKSDRAANVTRTCAYAEAAFCFGPTGKPKLPCMMGEKADCARCGCVLPFHIAMLGDRSLAFREIIRGMTGLYTMNREQPART